MDTFSLSLGIGTVMISKKKTLFFSILVGIMHFIMPILGNKIGIKLVEIFMLKSNFLLGIILIYLGITMLIEIFKPNEEPKSLNIIQMFLIAFQQGLV